MPVRLIEELTSRKQEKIAMFLTFERVVAVLIGFLPLFLISGSWSSLVRIPVCAGGAALGYLLTVEVQGLPLYEQLLWSGRGWLRLRLQGDRLRPEDLPHTIWEDRPDPVLLRDGPIISAERVGEGDGIPMTAAFLPSPSPAALVDAQPDNEAPIGTTQGWPPDPQSPAALAGAQPDNSARVASPPAGDPDAASAGAAHADL